MALINSTNKSIPKYITTIFSYLSSLTEPNELNDHLFQELNEIDSETEGSFDSRYIHLYLQWEDFLVSQSALEGKHLTESEIREAITQQVPLEIIDPKMRLLFVSDRKRAIFIYELFIQYIVVYIIRNNGVESITSMLNTESEESHLKSITVNKSGLIFDKFNKELESASITDSAITSLFKRLYSMMFSIIERSYDEKTASGFFNRIYKTLQQIYNREIASIFLKILPDEVLGLDEWLSTLSKEELEREIEEKTHALNLLNESLEEKVKERTLELEKAYEELKTLDKKKTEFISVVAHQLRTPLSGFKWTFDMLLKGDLGELNEEHKDIIKKTSDTNERIIGIVNDMLNTEAIVSGGTEYIFENVLLSDLITSAISEIKNIAKKKNITIIRNEDENLSISVDIIKMTDAVQNIVDNAAKYTLEGGTITITTQIEGSNTIISVSDTGIGIPKTSQAHIFNRFFRADNALRTHANGSGLGLFITKNIIESHCGHITFESIEGVGSTFNIILPKGCHNEEKSVK